jgi:hypothetical protein
MAFRVQQHACYKTIGEDVIIPKPPVWRCPLDSAAAADIIYVTAPVYITYMVALLDFTLLHTAMKNVCVLAVVWYGEKKVHKRASSAARLCWKFTTFQKAADGFYLHVYTLYSLSFGS